VFVNDFTDAFSIGTKDKFCHVNRLHDRTYKPICHVKSLHDKSEIACARLRSNCNFDMTEFGGRGIKDNYAHMKIQHELLESQNRTSDFKA
jgi:hypothetical protein